MAAVGTRWTRGAVRVLTALALAMALGLAAFGASGCAPASEPEEVHSADVEPQVYTAVEKAIRDEGYEVTSRNLRMSYGADQKTVTVSGAFVAPAAEGGGEFGVLTLEDQAGSWVVVEKQ